MIETPRVIIQIEQAQSGGFVVSRDGRPFKAGTLKECLDYIGLELKSAQVGPINRAHDVAGYTTEEEFDRQAAAQDPVTGSVRFAK